MHTHICVCACVEIGWENTGLPLGMPRLCVLLQSGRPLLWRRRSAGLPERRETLLWIKLTGLINNFAGKLMYNSLDPRGFCVILTTFYLVFLWKEKKKKLERRQATLKVHIYNQFLKNLVIITYSLYSQNYYFTWVSCLHQAGILLHVYNSKSSVKWQISIIIAEPGLIRYYHPTQVADTV